jgi:hypothetical protein
VWQLNNETGFKKADYFADEAIAPKYFSPSKKFPSQDKHHTARSLPGLEISADIILWKCFMYLWHLSIPLK